jgi:hypothetical protein
LSNQRDSPPAPGETIIARLALYDDTGFVSRHEAEQALESAGEYLKVIRVDIAARKP